MDTASERAYTELLRQLANPMSTQPETLAEAFREVERLHASGQIEDWQMQNASEAYARTGSKIGEAAHWVVGKAKDTLQSAADDVGERANRALASYTSADPVRAMLIAAAAGAVAMALASMVVRSGVRTVSRRIHR